MKVYSAVLFQLHWRSEVFIPWVPSSPNPKKKSTRQFLKEVRSRVIHPYKVRTGFQVSSHTCSLPPGYTVVIAYADVTDTDPIRGTYRLSWNHQDIAKVTSEKRAQLNQTISPIKAKRSTCQNDLHSLQRLR